MTEKEKEVIWTISPITGREMVIQEFYESTGVSKVDISTGYFTNEHPLNYKRNPNNEIEDYEKDMPDTIKKLRFDDGESYWYPSVIQNEDEVVFPTGEGYKDIVWHYAKMKKFDNTIGKVIDTDTIEDHPSYLEASKRIRGHHLGNI